MRTYEFQDIEGNELTVQYSSLATEDALRIYIKKEANDKNEKTDCCLHLSIPQANILIHSLKELIDNIE